MVNERKWILYSQPCFNDNYYRVVRESTSLNLLNLTNLYYNMYIQGGKNDGRLDDF